MTIVLAAVEADTCARAVLGTAIALADLFDSDAVALHVHENGSGSPEALVAAAGVELRETAGEAIEQIVAAARAPDVAALALGARGVHGGPQPAGHTALEVITRVPKPVVVVPPRAEPLRQISRLLVPLEGSRASSQALQETLQLAHEHRLEILVLHIHSPATVPAFSDHEPHATRTWDQEFLSRYIATPHNRVQLVRRLGVPADDIPAVAHEMAVHLIVLAWSQDLSPGRARVVSETLALSDVPVLLIPTT